MKYKRIADQEFNVTDSKDKQKQTDLIAHSPGIMFYRYFSMQATEPLKFDSKTRIQIESDICLGNGRPSSSCFEKARLMALRILEQVSK